MTEGAICQRRYIASLVYITYLNPAGWGGLVAKDRRHQRRQHPVTGSGLDGHEPNAAIGPVTRATASIMAGSRPARREVGGAMPGRPGLSPHAYIPIDSDTRLGHFETEAGKDCQGVL